MKKTRKVVLPQTISTANTLEPVNVWTITYSVDSIIRDRIQAVLLKAKQWQKNCGCRKKRTRYPFCESFCSSLDELLEPLRSLKFAKRLKPRRTR